MLPPSKRLHVRSIRAGLTTYLYTGECMTNLQERANALLLHQNTVSDQEIVQNLIARQLEIMEQFPEVREAIINSVFLHAIGTLCSLHTGRQSLSSHAKAFTEQTMDTNKFPTVTKTRKASPQK